MRKTYYRTCEYCGSTLDPGEKCDCQKGRDSYGTTGKETTYRRIPDVYAKSRMEREEKTEIVY